MRRSPDKLNAHLPEIDAVVLQTGVLNRLATAIENVAAIGYVGLARDDVARLQSIRSQIALGSDKTRYATAGVMAAYNDSGLVETLRAPER